MWRILCVMITPYFPTIKWKIEWFTTSCFWDHGNQRLLDHSIPKPVIIWCCCIKLRKVAISWISKDLFLSFIFEVQSHVKYMYLSIHHSNDEPCLIIGKYNELVAWLHLVWRRSVNSPGTTKPLMDLKGEVNGIDLWIGIVSHIEYITIILHTVCAVLCTGPWFNIKMPSY